MTDDEAKPRPWPGDGGVLGPEEEGWPAPLDPHDVYAGTSGDPETIQSLLSHPAYDFSAMAEAANLYPAHDSEDPKWLGTWERVYPGMDRGPTQNDLERIREVFGAEITAVFAMRIWRMRRALTSALSQQEANHNAIGELRKDILTLLETQAAGVAIAKIYDLVNDEDGEYRW